MQIKARGCHDSQRRIWWLYMAWRRIHRVHLVTFSGPQRRKRKASLTAKTCRSCVVQREEDAKRHGERRDLRLEIAVSSEISAYTPSHRHPTPPPPLSSATHLPPALDQLVPMQRFYYGTLSNHRMGCLSVLSVCLLQVVFSAQCRQCSMLLTCNLCVWGRKKSPPTYMAVDAGWCIRSSQSIFWMLAVRSGLCRLVAKG